jgi:hypothetical protein
VGAHAIRGGRRTVQRTPIGGMLFLLEPWPLLRSAARLAHAVTDAKGLEEANAILHRMGVRSELDSERDNAAAEAGTATSR